jgi:hypothetical protein
VSEPQVPKNEEPIRGYTTPAWGDHPVSGIAVVDEFLTEYIDPNKSSYVRLPEGSPYPNERDFPNHRLLKEVMVREGLNARYWCNGYRNQDQYNYNQTYSGEENSHPIFTRRYLIRRDLYSPIVKESKFTGIYLIQVTSGGAGYNPDVPPTVTIAGGGGAGATAVAVVSSEGAVEWVYLTSEGSGFTSQPTVSFSSGAATAVAKLQLDTGVVYQIDVTNGGTGYSSAPTVTLTGGGGTLATAVAQVSGGSVVAVLVTAYGIGYTSAPGVVFAGGGGSNAAATAVIETATCRLIKEDSQQFGEEDPRRSLYLLVVRTYETFPGPYLIQHDYEPYLDIYVTTLKRTVLASTVPPDMTYVNVTEGEVTEYQPFSKHRAAQMISRINTGIVWENGGADFEYEGTANFSFPDELEAIDGTVPVTQLDWFFVWATDGNNLAWDIDLPFNVLEGYSGPCRAKFIRRLTFDPQDAAFKAALPQVTKINPQAHKIYTYGFDTSGPTARIITVAIPSTLHPEVTLNSGGLGTPSSGSFTLLQTIPATTPTTLPSGTEIVASVKPEQWRFRVWIYTIVKIFVP